MDDSKIRMIKIIDGFFKKKDFELVKNFALTKAHYTPKYFHNKEINKKNFYGNRWKLHNEPDLFKLFTDQTELKFKIKIKKIDAHNSSIDQRNLDTFKPHTDPAKINILIMIAGPTAVTNGTVFYTDGELDIHVGFKENRAIMFPSNKVHSNHASNITNLKRYTSTLFIKDYEE